VTEREPELINGRLPPLLNDDSEYASDPVVIATAAGWLGLAVLTLVVVWLRDKSKYGMPLFRRAPGHASHDLLRDEAILFEKSVGVRDDSWTPMRRQGTMGGALSSPVGQSRRLGGFSEEDEIDETPRAGVAPARSDSETDADEWEDAFDSPKGRLPAFPAKHAPEKPFGSMDKGASNPAMVSASMIGMMSNPTGPVDPSERGRLSALWNVDRRADARTLAEYEEKEQ
jgi:hypothetical protein